MHTFQIQFAELELNKSDIYLNLGYGGTEPDEQISEMLESCINKAHEICHPLAAFRFCTGNLLDQSTLALNEVPMKIGRIIAGYLDKSSHFALFVATAGQEYDDYLHQLKASGDIVSEYIADAVGSEIAEAAVRYVTQKIEEEAAKQDFRITNSYSPGYCGWHVREQKHLFSLFPEKPCGIVLNDSCLMHPVKSVSGMVGMGTAVELTPYSCEICGLQSCYKRKDSNE